MKKAQQIAQQIAQVLGTPFNVEPVAMSPQIAALVIRHERGCKVVEIVDLVEPVSDDLVALQCAHVRQIIELRAHDEKAGKTRTRAQAALVDLAHLDTPQYRECEECGALPGQECRPYCIARP